jgi:formate dehydrogenase iron-sulfur subunit
MSKSFFIDTTVCTACRGCQVACKQWHDLPAEKTVNRGSYQNPEDLSFSTYKLVRMNETVIDGQLKWLFFPDQCRHCNDAPCKDTALDDNAIYEDSLTGAVIYTAQTKDLDAEEIIDSCPYNIPRKSEDGTLSKCDMCVDRIHNGLEPACVATCPTGSMNFGENSEMITLAKQRLAIVKKKYLKAMLLDPDDVNVIYLVAHDPELYSEYAVASADSFGITRSVAIRKMMGPFAKVFRI